MYTFDEAKAVPFMATAQIQQWALTLSAYKYTIQYKAGKDHANADGPSEVPKPAETILLMAFFSVSYSHPTANSP